jgi:hypothetical protein
LVSPLISSGVVATASPPPFPARRRTVATMTTDATSAMAGRPQTHHGSGAGGVRSAGSTGTLSGDSTETW